MIRRPRAWLRPAQCCHSVGRRSTFTSLIGAILDGTGEEVVSGAPYNPDYSPAVIIDHTCLTKRFGVEFLLLDVGHRQYLEGAEPPIPVTALLLSILRMDLFVGAWVSRSFSIAQMSPLDETAGSRQ
jgi:hypothetical protein